MRKRDTTTRCFVCIEIGHLFKNCMNQGRIEDGKKEKDNNIRKKIRKQWVHKSPENASHNTKIVDTQVNELDGTIIST